MTTTKVPRGEKTRFVLEHGPKEPVEAIIAAARKAGLRITPQHVYQVRSRLRIEPASVGAMRPAKRPERAVRSAEQQFQDIALAIGLVRSVELIHQTRSLARGIINGIGAPA